MDPQFWHQRWENREIGFHQEGGNRHLQELWRGMAAKQGGVFVPLCGKSRDLLWLRERGHPVVGVELSPIAVAELFRESGLSPEVQNGCYRGPDLTIHCRDFFALRPEEVGEVAAVYDRAALVALPPDLRRAYVAHLKALVPPSAPILLITLEYEQAQMEGPPFSVDECEVRLLFEDRYEVYRLREADALDERLRGRGLSRLDEVVYRIVPR